MLLLAVMAPADTEAIVARMLEAEQRQHLELRESTSERKYRMENLRFKKSAEMRVRFEYTFPGEKSYVVLAESGPGAVRSQVFRRMLESERSNSKGQAREATRISPENYTFEFLRTEPLDGRPAHVLKCEPRTKNAFLFRGTIWVDVEDSAVAKIEGAPAQKPSFWVRKTRFVHRYTKVGPFWVAASNVSESEILVFGKTTVSIDYFGYQINEKSQAVGLVQTQAGQTGSR